MSRAAAAALVLSACVSLPPLPADRDGLRAVQGVTRGMGWRLWVDPSAKAPQRVAVWLHPHGEAGRDLVGPLAPVFARHGYALLEPLSETNDVWTGVEANIVFGDVLPAAAAAGHADPQGPLVLGWSAGGQLALHLWRMAPDALGGVVVVGTTPELVPGTWPDRARLEGTAILSLVGADERGAADWVRALPAWKEHGVPVTLSIVPGRGHEWLLAGPDEVALLDAWLAALAP